MQCGHTYGRSLNGLPRTMLRSNVFPLAHQMGHSLSAHSQVMLVAPIR